MAEWQDADFYSDETSKVARVPVVGGYAVVVISALVLTVGSLWAYYAELDIVTHGIGQVVPSYGVPELQNNEGGLVTDIFVREGDTVKKNDPIIQLINPTIISNLKQARAKKAVLDLSLKRLIAEYNQAALSYTEDEKKSYPVVVYRQEEAFKIREILFKDTRKVANSLLEGALAEQEILNKKLNGLEKQESLLLQESQIIFPLVEKGTLPAVQGVELQQQLSEVQNQLAIEKSRGPEVKESIGEAEQKIKEVEQSWIRGIAEKVSALRGEIEQVNERILGSVSAVDRSKMVADEDGVIKTLNVNSIGDVVKPGETVAELVPLGEKLLVETQLEPKDRGQIKKGATANVKITAYDASIFGSLIGEVVNISPDTTQDERNPNRKYFTVIVSTEKDFLVDKRTGKDLKIIPGMAASVDIRTGSLSVLTRLLRPMRNMIQEAGKEG